MTLLTPVQMLNTNLTNLKEVVSELKRQGADALSGMLSHMAIACAVPAAHIRRGTTYAYSAGAELLNEMYQQKYFPQATVIWIGPSASPIVCHTCHVPLTTTAAFEQWRQLVGWRGGSVLVPALWAPTLNYSDPIFGSSIEFNKEFSKART